MRSDIVMALELAGLDVSLQQTLPFIPLQRHEEGAPIPIGMDVPVVSRGRSTVVRLPPISDLLVPTGEQEPSETFLALVEQTVVEYCAERGRAEWDREIERIYRRLRLDPDGSDDNPLFSYVQGAIRLYLAISEAGAEELEALLERLIKSTRHFGTSQVSTNYVRLVGQQL